MQKRIPNTLQYVIMVRLAKLELKKFDGNILKQKEFSFAFYSIIHQKKIQKRVDQFSYLRSQHVGSANETTARLDATNDNYDIVTKLLKKRSGKNKL